MKSESKLSGRRTISVCAGMVALAWGVQAQTLAWYRFDEAATGEKPTAGEATILNAVDPARFPATAWTEAKDGSYSTDATYLATYADAFPSGAKVYDPLSGTLSGNERCLQFKSNGSIYGDSYGTFLTVEDDARLHVPSVTVELFVRFDGAADLPLRRNLLVYPSDNGTRVWSLCVAQVGVPEFRVAYLKDGVATNGNTLFGDVSIKDGKWHHLALVVEDSGLAIKVSLYQDYRLAKSEWLGGPLAYGTSGQVLSIGHEAGVTYGAWPGLIDEVRISDAALSPAQFLRPNTGWANCHPETVVYVPFSGLPFFGTDALTSSVLQNQAVPTPFATINGVTLTGADHAALSNEVAVAHERRDLLSETAVTNEAALFTTVRSDAYDLSPALWVDDVVDGTHTALTNSFTLEIFGKFEKPSGKGTGKTSYLFHAITSTGSLIVSVRPDGTAVLQPGWTEVGSAQICDGQWHHVAVSYDKPNQTFALYVDYRLVGSKSGLAVDAGGVPTWCPNIQVLNGYHNDQAGVHGLSDGFRLTARALTPQEFLTGHAVADADYAAWIDFEDGTGVLPYADVTPAGVLSATAEGAAPSLSTRRPGKWLEAADGTPGRANRKALALTGGSVVWGRNLMIENLASQTVEFFLRGTAAEEGASLVRLADGAGNSVWAVEATADGAARVRVGETVHTFETVSLMGGAWHHWAVTFAAEADGMVVTLWRDGADVGRFTAVDGLTRTFTSSSLIVGGDAAFTGHIDEIRISPRVLNADELLKRYRTGVLYLIR